MKKNPKKSPPRLPGSKNWTKTMDRLIRVNHAGEFGAQRIYAGQIAVLGKSKIGKTLYHMAEQEDVHLQGFEKLMRAHRARPTALYPIWHFAGYALGYATAKMGEKAAMACTVAVEEVIEEHYQKQIDMLGTREPELKKMIKKFQADEAEHKKIGLHHDAESAKHYPLLRRLIGGGSRVAIWLSERV